MKILVFVKQIPEISRIEFDPKTKRIVRDKVPLIINPFDKRAVEEGIRIKEKIGGEVVVATMGPPSAADVLNNSLRMGADRAILISDPAYAGSDTWVTSRILSLVTKKISPDLVLRRLESSCNFHEDFTVFALNLIGFEWGNIT